MGKRCWLSLQSKSSGTIYSWCVADLLVTKFNITNSIIFQLALPGFISYLHLQIPVHAAEHYYLHTKPVENITPNTPVLHDPDSNVYFRENEGRFLAGGFEPEAKVRHLSNKNILES